MTTKAQQKEWYQEHKEKVRANTKKYYEKHKKARICATPKCRKKIKSYMPSDCKICELCSINHIRDLVGKPPIIIKKKNCLKCNKNFDSQGNWNRICDYCTHQNKEAGYGMMPEYSPDQY